MMQRQKKFFEADFYPFRYADERKNKAQSEHDSALFFRG